MRLLTLLFFITTFINAGRYDKVKITEEISQVLVYHKGKAVKIHRIQDVKNHLTGTYAKISYPCPDMCIQPISINDKVETVGEVEVMKFIKNQVNHNKGALIDARPQKFYNQGTIPSAINIPFFLSKDKKAIDGILTVLGMKKRADGKWNSSKAIDILVYCNGPWCAKSKQLITALVKKGYPTKKIQYYRGGFQMWKSLGLTTVKTK